MVSEKYYRGVLHTDFPHLSFHKLKKDECSFCFSFKNMKDDEKALHEFDYNEHHRRKCRVRQLKSDHKKIAQDDPSVVAATFNLEQVLLCPKLAVSSLFYRRKLATYTLTVYGLDSSDVTCHMWHEGQGGRGSCEIASAMAKFLTSLPNSVKKEILYSDTCAGQNRNQNFSAMYLSTVQNCSIETIDHV